MLSTGLHFASESTSRNKRPTTCFRGDTPKQGAVRQVMPQCRLLSKHDY